jgi:hypothetical protein
LTGINGRDPAPDVQTELEQDENTTYNDRSIQDFLASLSNRRLIDRADYEARARRGVNPFANMTGNGVAVNQFVFVTTKVKAVISDADHIQQRNRVHNVELLVAGTFAPKHVDDETNLAIDNHLFEAEMDSIIQAHVNDHMVLSPIATDTM